MLITPETCAHEVLEVIPLVMQAIRSDMRQHRSAELAVPHFRVLAFLDGNSGASLSAVAEHVGLRLPSMSALIDGLVERGLVARRQSAVDRRRVVLTLTKRGQAALDAARQATLEHLTQRLSALSAAERDRVVGGLLTLRGVFASAPTRESQE